MIANLDSRLHNLESYRPNRRQVCWNKNGHFAYKICKNRELYKITAGLLVNARRPRDRGWPCRSECSQGVLIGVFALFRALLLLSALHPALAATPFCPAGR